MRPSDVFLGDDGLCSLQSPALFGGSGPAQGRPKLPSLCSSLERCLKKRYILMPPITRRARKAALPMAIPARAPLLRPELEWGVTEGVLLGVLL